MRKFQQNQFTLFEIAQLIQETLEEGVGDSYWVTAEIAEYKINRTGHCYLELVEKEESGTQPKAKIRATIWAGVFRVIKPFFETSTGVKFDAGIKVKVLCRVNFHSVYGFSLNIQDIDPAFTLGDIEQQRRETLARLIADGIIDMNKELELSILPKRIAIVSSPTAAGYQDFINQLDTNAYGYRFFYKIFSATVQGSKAEESIVDALNRIHFEIENWDVVAIIRGGGSQTDLSCFDSYNLAANIAQFPLPVITGIGHEKDTTIVDMVAHTRLKTPTAAAEFLVNLFAEAEGLTNSLADDFQQQVQLLISEYESYLSSINIKITPMILKQASNLRISLQRLAFGLHDCSQKFIQNRKNEVNNLVTGLKNEVASRNSSELNRLISYKKNAIYTTNRLIDREKTKHSIIVNTINLIEPIRVLQRGYSVTLVNGKPIKSIEEININDTMETFIAEGRIESAVKKCEKNTFTLKET